MTTIFSFCENLRYPQATLDLELISIEFEAFKIKAFSTNVLLEI